ncbi:MAG: L-threonylcarbamoyladenylate synthase [Hyphomicrobiaceae bacterium]
MTAPVLSIADPTARAEAVRILGAGGLVAFPTETVYGLGADATNEEAVARIFEAKGRPRFNPLISHLHDRPSAFALAETNPVAQQLAERWWPGPLTLVLKRRPDCRVAWLACAGLDTIALRVPADQTTRAFLEEVARPIAAPSANRSGRISPTAAAHVSEELGDRIDLILDGGACTVGLESTVLDLSGEHPRLLRHGAVTREAIEEMTGPVAEVEAGAALEAPAAPGMMASHYAPRARLRMDVREPLSGELYLDFGATRPDAAADLSPTANLVEAAARLFALLRELDRPGIAGIAVAPIPESGLGAAIRDRLTRAAH